MVALRAIVNNNAYIDNEPKGDATYLGMLWLGVYLLARSIDYSKRMFLSFDFKALILRNGMEVLIANFGFALNLVLNLESWA